MTNTAIGSKIDDVTPTRSRLWIDVLSPSKRAVGGDRPVPAGLPHRGRPGPRRHGPGPAAADAAARVGLEDLRLPRGQGEARHEGAGHEHDNKNAGIRKRGRVLRGVVLAVVLATAALVVPNSTVQPADVELVKLRTAEGVDAGRTTSSGSWPSGSDARPGQDMTRTRGDALQLIGMNTKTGAASAIGIPRDSWVSIPGHGYDKINSSLYFGGPELLGRDGREPGRRAARLRLRHPLPVLRGHDRRHRRHRGEQPGRVQRRVPQAEGLQGRPDPPRRLRRDGVLPDPAQPDPRRLRPLGQPAARAARHPGQDPGEGRHARASSRRA